MDKISFAMPKNKWDFWKIISLVLLVLLSVFLLYPLITIGYKSLLNTEGNFTLSNYKDFFTLKYYTSALKHSFAVCSLATIFAALISIPIAYISSRYTIAGKKLLNTIIIMSMISPPFIGAYSWILLFGRSGVITVFFKSIGIIVPSIYGFPGIILVFTVKFFPLIYLYVSGALSSIDVSLEEAAENLGMSRLKRIWTITFPLILPTISAAMLMTFMAALADFGTPMLIGEGYKVLPVLIYQHYLSETGGDATMASTLSVIIILCALLVLLIQKFIVSRRNYNMNMLRPPEVIKITGGKKFIATALCYIVAFVGILPQLTVLFTSFLKTSGPLFVKGFSTDSYRNVFGKLARSLTNTFTFSLIAIIIMVVAGLIIAYLSVRRKNHLNTALDILVMFPYVIPGAVLGISLLLSFNQKPLLFTGTWFIMVLAYVIRKLPYTVRSASAILYQIDPAIEEASINLGVSPARTFFKTTAILMLPGVFSGAIMSWITTINELSSSIMLYTSKTSTISVSVYTEVLRGNFGTAAALAVILSFTSIMSVFLFTKLSGGKTISL
ncbi:iron ABC transporter permease [Treponema sp. HNW]|uniref:ABC transporter permease n=1 Tax=Treponema sp. HNW TaxID=3116654 RepID=UPI003D0F7217